MTSGRDAFSALSDANDGLRPTRALIDLDVLATNVRRLKDLLSPSTTLMAVVKANAYGHGATTVARTTLSHGAAALAVATVDEGIELRDDGIDADILVLGPILASEIERALRHRLQLIAVSPATASYVSDAAHRLGLSWRPGLHVKLDSGLHRYGSDLETAIATARQIDQDHSLELAGVTTHFASADDPSAPVTDEQMSRFTAFVSTLAAERIAPRFRHVANSAATLRSPGFHLDMVRVGIALYGLAPSSHCPLPATVRPVMRLVSRVARIHALRPGDTVGYGQTFTADRPIRAALIPIGYGDGYRRALSSTAWMAVQKQRAPVLGRVSMDSTVIGVPDEVHLALEEEVLVFGDGSGGEPTVDDLARLTGTISYEVVCGLTARVPRIYIHDSVALPRETRGTPGQRFKVSS